MSVHRSFARVLLGNLLAMFLASPALATEEYRFPPRTIKGFDRANQLPTEPNERLIDARLPGLAVAVKRTGESRNISKEKLVYLREVQKAFGDAKQMEQLVSLYHREIQVTENGRSYWLPIQEPQLPELIQAVSVGQEFTVYARYLGGTHGIGRVYIAIGFNKAVKRPARERCFANELAGVRVGEPIENVRERLTRLYGEPFYE